ncbi:MAG: LysR family transcriptional regulator [Bacteroidetes bacterium]|jgi:DNA-binding transcriptional LysR family regulator|nr:LysR family transcriptional regulator [Bacteroidota bacterium]
MSDFRLEVFYTVAKRLSFTKAAAELFITQPAVTKHIRELEDQYKAKLFERKGNHIALTQAGKLLLHHAERVFELYRNVEFEINSLSKRKEGLLRIGASTTIAQYIVAPLLAKFRGKYPDVQLSLITGNTEQVEKALLAKEIEIGIIEGYSKNPEISYHEFLKDELVLVCSSKHPLANRNSLRPDELKTISFIVREQGSGTLEVIDHALKEAGINHAELKVEIRLGNTESIKSYLLNSSAMAFVSVHAIIDEVKRGELKIIDVENLIIERSFYLINLQGRITGLADLFFHFVNHKS